MNFASLVPWIFVGAGIFALSRQQSEGMMDDGTAVFYMIGVSWCGHCKDAKPEFVKLGRQQTINGRAVNMRFVDAEKQKAVAQKYGVESYPTFILSIDGRTVPYNGARTAAAFKAFLESAVR
jgi:thioredoxin-like negative regulator of GroEL